MSVEWTTVGMLSATVDECSRRDGRTVGVPEVSAVHVAKEVANFNIASRCGAKRDASADAQVGPQSVDVVPPSPTPRARKIQYVYFMHLCYRVGLSLYGASDY